MKKALVMASSLLFFLSIVPAAFSADTAKIGVFDFQKILKESNAGKIAQEKIQKKGKAFQAQINKEKNGIEKIRKSFERGALVLSKEKQKEKQREFRIRVNDFKEMQDFIAKSAKQMEFNYINKVKNEVVDIVKTMGKKEGYLIIFEKQNAGVVYNKAGSDITNKIIKVYNSKVPYKK